MFQQLHAQKMLCNILFIWSKLNADLSYRQGMHELAAVCFWVVYQDRLDLPHPDPLAVLFDAQYVEHDCSVLFFKLMRSVKQWYEVGHARMRSSDKAPVNQVDLADTCGAALQQNTFGLCKTFGSRVVQSFRKTRS